MGGNSERGRLAVVGAGQAAAALVEQLRRGGYDGAITVIGDEPVAPYRRPPLSKDYFKGTTHADRLTLRPLAAFEADGVRMRLATRVAAIDRPGQTVVTADGTRLSWSTLVLATGARARRLPIEGMDAENVFTLRTLADADRLRAAAGAASARGGRAVIVGGGFIGLEAAAVLREAGMAVSVVEAASRLMQRAVSFPVSAACLAAHRRRGVEIRLEAAVAEALRRNGRVAGVRLATGETLEADIVLAGVGAEPETSLAEAAGIACAGGIAVDTGCRTSVPDIYAIGDCTALNHARYPGRLRFESVHNAIDQARVAAGRILGRETVYDTPPRFWSDQFDIRLQISGWAAAADGFDTFGDGDGLLVAHYDDADSLVCCETINRSADHLAAQRLLTGGAPVPRRSIAEAGGNLKAVLRARR